MDTEDVDLMSLEWERLFLKILDRHALFVRLEITMLPILIQS